LIPINPSYVPETDAQELARNLFVSSLPDTERVITQVTPEIGFFDCGEYFESVFCPHCHTDLSDWWLDAMNLAYETSFHDLTVTVPCCAKTVSLNDLEYVYPMGFARFVLQARNPPTYQVDMEITKQLELILNTPLREIWARY